jgi:hypothetical protein
MGGQSLSPGMVRGRRAACFLVCRRRRGLAIAWLLIWGTVFLTMLGLAVEIGNIYLAQSELETALESAALAGAKAWYDRRELPDAAIARLEARDYAVAYAEANLSSGQPVALDHNDSPPTSPPNDNTSCNGDIVLGAITGTAPDGLLFDAGAVPDLDVGGFGVWIQKRFPVTSLCQQLFHLPLGPFHVSAEVTAVCEGSGTPQLVRIKTFTCP